MRIPTDPDFSYFYAAYKQGGFKDHIIADLPPLLFQDAMEQLLGSVSYDWIVDVGRLPVGLFLGKEVMAGYAAEIQVDWFPWATPRNRVEATAAFIKYASRQIKLFIYADSGSELFFTRLATQYRMLRKGCKITGGGEDKMFFYSPGPF